MRKKHMWWIAFVGILLLAGALWGPVVSNVEQPKYELVSKDRSIEIRDYPSMIVAQTDATGHRDDSDPRRVSSDCRLHLRQQPILPKGIHDRAGDAAGQ